MAKYDDYVLSLCSEIPFSDIEIIIMKFIKEAEIDMGSELDAVAVPRVVDFVCKDYSHLPLYAIASAFKKGALGHYGPGRLIPRTINNWLSEMSQVQLYKSKGLADKNESKKWDDLHKYPAGRAICLKIDWYNSGLINGNDWDNIPLKELAGMLGRGEVPVTKDFGINNT